MKTLLGTTRRNLSTALPVFNTKWGYVTSVVGLAGYAWTAYWTVTSWGGWPVAVLVLVSFAVVAAVALAWWGEREVRREAQADLARAKDEHAQQKAEMDKLHGQLQEHAASLEAQLRSEEEGRNEWLQRERTQMEADYLREASEREERAQRHTL